MTSRELFGRIVGALDDAGIPHMLTGSFASAYHGSPRATQDIDFVIEADADRLRTFVQSLPPAEYYVDEEAALDALRDETQFNVIDLATGWKIDLVPRKSRPFSREEFSRRRAVEFEGTSLSIASLEDLIIAKLDWARQGQSERQLADVAALLAIPGREVDRAYVERWVNELGLERQWSVVNARAND